VAFDERENFDSPGNFSNPNAFTAQSPGQSLFCGYTDDGAGDTLATASLIATFSSGTPAQKPVNTTKPRVMRSGNRLRCTRGKWSNSPTHFSYRWLVAGKTKPAPLGRSWPSRASCAGTGCGLASRHRTPPARARC
jgi:hypothetical protein